MKSENGRLQSVAFELQARLESLNQQDKDNAAQLAALRAQLEPFQKVANLRYPGDEAALAKLHEDLTKQEVQIMDLGQTADEQKKTIGSLQKLSENQKKEIAGLKNKLAEMENQMDAQEVATWTFEGQMRLWNGQFIDGPVAGWIDSYKEEKTGEASQWSCASEAIFHYREIMEGYPKYPFPYYVLSQCLKTQGETSWKGYANKGLVILKKTTKIPGHVQDHDRILGELQNLLDTP
jgi:hypothetical protein